MGMETDSRVDKLLYLFASLASRFYSEATRDWAKQTVEELEENGIKEITKEEARSSDYLRENVLIIRLEDDNEETVKVFAGDERQRGLTALVIAIKYRFEQYWVIFLIPVILFLIGLQGEQILSLTNLGIYFDLFGAIITVRGLYRTPTEIDYQSAFTMPSNPIGSPEDRLVAAVETIDSMFGSMLLALGFALQLVAVSGTLFTLAIVLLVLIVWLALR